MAGTARSSGCADEGAASDIGSIKAVIDWLNGRATAVDIEGNPVEGVLDQRQGRDDRQVVRRDARQRRRGHRRQGPEDDRADQRDQLLVRLRPLAGPAVLLQLPDRSCRSTSSGRGPGRVDCSAINSQMAQDDGDETGAYTTFWSQRDYRAAPPPSAAKVTASVFLVHGLQDTNVKTVNFGRWYELLQQNGVVTKVWLSRLGHMDPFDYRRKLWVDTLHRWFDNQLMGIDNGILDEPRVDVEKSPGNVGDVGHVAGVGQRRAADVPRRRVADDGRARERHGHVHEQTRTRARRTAVAKGANPHRLLYVTGSLDQDLRISGEPTVAADDHAARLDRPGGRGAGRLRDAGARARRRRGQHDAEHAVLLGRVDVVRRRLLLSTASRTGCPRRSRCWRAGGRG